ncbi:hypothetical protein INT47_005157 [Mucor saturninus]|uniref:Uncharacterized protein n=1 Tax=Mucor saturninus TaxID=64648 RepID=A0A8H7QWH9_9FUNG|nr:hypothetical protein INT47_005157 [Mucor saturninus]
MPPAPQALHSSSVNPANLVELQVLTQVSSQLQSSGDVAGSIPYLAKIVQILENQQLEKKSSRYKQQCEQLRRVQADAHAQLGDAYYKTGQYVVCEHALLRSVKIWEKLVQQDSSVCGPLRAAYEQLKSSYEAMGKTQLAQHIETKLERLASIH